MSARKARPARGPTGLVWRGRRAWFDRRHSRFKGGRLAISLRTTDRDVAHQRHGVLVQLMDRGDWSVLEAIRDGEMHISDAQAALRDGDNRKLRRMGADSPRLGSAVERFLARKDATKAKKTVAQYRVRLRRFEMEMGADLPMDQFTPEEARRYLQAKKPDKPWAPTTQEAVRVCLGALWGMVMEEEAEELSRRNVQPSIQANPWSGLDMPEIRPTRTAFLSPEEWRALDQAMAGQEYRALVALAFLAGLRQGEIRHLRTDVDVLLEGPEPVVKVQSRKGEHPWRPKTKRGERDVPVTPSLLRILESHRKTFAGDRYFIRIMKRDEPIADATAMRWTRLAYESAGIKYGREGDGLTLHSGRHTFASWLAQDGVPLNVVAKLIGDTTKVVEDVYAHLIPDTFRSAVGFIERRLQNNGSPT